MKKIWFIAFVGFFFTCTGNKVYQKTSTTSFPIKVQGITGVIEVRIIEDEMVLYVDNVVQGRRKIAAIAAESSHTSSKEKSDTDRKTEISDSSKSYINANIGYSYLQKLALNLTSRTIELPDPIAQLAVATHRKPRKVLLIGLGTGKTAMDLQRMGLWVESVEIEPKIIEFARKYFGFHGKAYAADGADFIKTTWRRYDVIILDAFAGLSLPKTLVSPEAMTNYKKILAPGGTLLMRIYADPDSLEFAVLRQKLNYSFFERVYRSVPGKGKQFLYLVFGGQRLLSPIGIPLFVNFRGYDKLYNYGYPINLLPGKKLRTKVTGHLIKYGKDKVLCLDLPHIDMGARRIKLTGKTEKLAEALKGYNEFP